MRRTILVVTVLCLFLGLSATSLAMVVGTSQRHHYKHHPECHQQECADKADALFNKHKQKQRRRREARERQEARKAQHSMSALESCIIRKESGGNPQAVNGIYSGIGQWEESRWISDGGGRYASTPLGATYAEQEKVLRGEGEAGMINQQGQYDGCA